MHLYAGFFPPFVKITYVNYFKNLENRKVPGDKKKSPFNLTTWEQL